MRFVLSCLRVRELVSFLTDRIKSFFKKNVSSCLYGMCMCTHLRMWESTLPYECVCVLVPVGVGGVRAQVTQCLLSLTWHLHFWDLVFTRPVSRVWLNWLSSESWICTHAHKCTHMHMSLSRPLCFPLSCPLPLLNSIRLLAPWGGGWTLCQFSFGIQPLSHLAVADTLVTCPANRLTSWNFYLSRSIEGTVIGTGWACWGSWEKPFVSSAPRSMELHWPPNSLSFVSVSCLTS